MREFLRRPRSALIMGGVVCLVVVAVLAVTVAASGSSGHKPDPAAKTFTLKQLGHAGQHVSLAAFAGRPVIVNFFASWCGPCQKETPLLARFYAQHHGRIQIIGVDSNDKTGNAVKFVAKMGVRYPVGVDPFPANTAVSYGVVALPQTFFLNARHHIVKHVIGGVTASELSAWADQLGGTGR
jgi:cytochrome c biogenesis protein CcmG/thiol:disulfide interchange protein DsbE